MKNLVKNLAMILVRTSIGAVVNISEEWSVVPHSPSVVLEVADPVSWAVPPVSATK
jgi:hypothetical protein